MARRPDIRDLSSYDSALRRSGDVSIGAYARQQRRKQILIASFGIATLIGAGWLYSVVTPDDLEQPPGRVTIAVECSKEECGYRGMTEIDIANEAFPVVCPRCQDRSCHKLWTCRNCGTQFTVRPGLTDLRCPNPNCGSSAVGATEELPADSDVQ